MVAEEGHVSEHLQDDQPVFARPFELLPGPPFADPEVVKALAARGYTVRTETSGSWAMEELPLKGYDFAFPSSRAPADGNSAFSDPITPRTVLVAVLVSCFSRPATTAAATPPISSTARTIPTMRFTPRACSRNSTFQAELGVRGVKCPSR